MAKTTSTKGVSVEKVDPASKPKETMFISGPIQIPSSFSFTKDEFFKRFKGQKTGNKDLRTIYNEYAEWFKKNK